MKLSTRGRYGLRAMHQLAEKSNKGPVPLSEIALAQDISLHYLEQIMRKLRLDGLVLSTRGAQGGYALAKPASEIYVGEILRSLEGDLRIVDCKDCNESEDSVCERADDCPTFALWEKINTEISGVVDQTTLADMIEGNV